MNGYNSGSQAADGVRRERLGCKIAERGAKNGGGKMLCGGRRGRRGQGGGVERERGDRGRKKHVCASHTHTNNAQIMRPNVECSV